MFEWSKNVLIIIMLLPLALSQVEAQEYEAGIDYEVLPQAIRTANPIKLRLMKYFITCVFIAITLREPFTPGQISYPQMLIFSAPLQFGKLHWSRSPEPTTRLKH